ncbi:MAG TPA: Ku protein [Caulobacteraceae bacterium]|jgi:DNA end-binding protein Ku|nr:Ku protein [Caulobacteraceae bacterium]
MATRPSWQGHLKLSLVTCPVALYSAVNPRGDVHFNLLNPKTGNRIKMVTTDPDSGPVERSTLIKGYEIEKGRFITVTDDEIKSVRLESTRTIDIERFVDVSDIDRLYWNDPYYLVPDGKMAAEAYAVIRASMEQSGRIALGRVVLHTRERLLALEPRDKGIVAYSLRTRDEVRAPAEFFRDVPDAVPDKGMVEIAGKIIEQLEGPFEPSEFVDHYEAALKALIASKDKGEKPKAQPAPKDTPASDLMEALRRSLQRGAAPPARKTPARAAPAARKPAAPKTARRKAS